MPNRIPYVAAALFGLFAASTPAQAQYAPFPCTWTPGERQIGQTMQGPVVVPLCIYEAPPQSSSRKPDSNDEGDDHYVPGYIPGPRPEPPKGWRPLYGAFVDWVVRQDEDREDIVYGYAYILNQQTPELARQKVVDVCMKEALFPDPTSDCYPQLFDHPYVVVIQYPHHPSYSPGERGMFKAFEATNDNAISGEFVEREPGKWEYCANGRNHPQPCAILIGFERNGIWPDSSTGKKRK